MTKLTKEKKTTFLKKHKWHSFLKKYRSDHPELKGKTQQFVIKMARKEYHPTKCPTCRRSFKSNEWNKEQ